MDPTKEPTCVTDDLFHSSEFSDFLNADDLETLMHLCNSMGSCNTSSAEISSVRNSVLAMFDPLRPSNVKGAAPTGPMTLNLRESLVRLNCHQMASLRNTLVKYKEVCSPKEATPRLPLAKDGKENYCPINTANEKSPCLIDLDDASGKGSNEQTLSKSLPLSPKMSSMKDDLASLEEFLRTPSTVQVKKAEPMREVAERSSSHIDNTQSHCPVEVCEPKSPQPIVLLDLQQKHPIPTEGPQSTLSSSVHPSPTVVHCHIMDEELLTHTRLQLAEKIREAEMWRAKNDAFNKVLLAYEQSIDQALQAQQRQVETHQHDLETAINERDCLAEDLKTSVRAYSDSERRYDRSREMLSAYEANINLLSQNLEAARMKLSKSEQKYQAMKEQVHSKLQQASEFTIVSNKKLEAEKNALGLAVKRAEIKADSLNHALEQKNAENVELSTICEELLGKARAENG